MLDEWKPTSEYCSFIFELDLDSLLIPNKPSVAMNVGHAPSERIVLGVMVYRSAHVVRHREISVETVCVAELGLKSNCYRMFQYTAVLSGLYNVIEISNF
jgi:hypothetical protein